VRTAPPRVLWGSDWPWVQHEQHVAGFPPAWTGWASGSPIRRPHLILVDNPSRVFGSTSRWSKQQALIDVADLRTATTVVTEGVSRSLRGDPGVVRRRGGTVRPQDVHQTDHEAQPDQESGDAQAEPGRAA